MTDTAACPPGKVYDRLQILCDERIRELRQINKRMNGR